MATPAPVVPGHTQPTHISVTFTIVTNDQLRKIVFKLIKSSDSTDDSWSVSFRLEERSDATKDFDLVIQLDVAVDHNDTAKAAATMKNGLDSDQHAQALNAGDTAKDASTGAATQQDADADAGAVISARNPNSPN
jgi:hypothetical protein